MLKQLFAAFFVLTFFINFSFAEGYPQDYFRAPLDIPMLLAGNFGELRSNHFHAGIDIKTQGKEGLRVYSVADGFVSRIKIQEKGYGKVVYITHPNGYISVYAHLSRFQGRLAELVKEHQYKEESYTFDWYLDSTIYPVKKSQVLAFSGNSGGSGGPHLHFELRETSSEVPVNPLLFGFKIKDNIEPRVRGVVIYPMGARSTVEGKNSSRYYKVKKKAEVYVIDSLVDVSGSIGFGVECNDYLNGARNKCGVFDLSLTVNGDSIFEFKTDRISFEQSRYINAHCDYAFKKKRGRWVHKLYVLPNDGLENYPLLVNDGVLYTEKDSIYNVELRLVDVYGNASKLKMKVKGDQAPLVALKTPLNDHVADFEAGKTALYRSNNFEMDIPKASLYEDLAFRYSYVPSAGGQLSGVHHVHDYLTPLHQSMELRLKLERGVKDSSKLVIVRRQGKRKHYYAATMDNNWLKCKTRYFGDFFISTDTKAPSIKALNVSEGKNIKAQRVISFKIADDKTGISSYRMEANGKWVLMEYDYKKRLLYHQLDGTLKPGQHQLKLVVKDVVGNEKVFKAKVTL